MNLHHVSTGLTVLGVVSAAAGRQIEYLTQTRADMAETNGSGEVWASAPDMGPWVGLVRAYFMGSLTATVSQNSTLGPDRITVNAAYDLQAPAYFGTGHASGRVMVQTVFQVSQARTFQLSGDIPPNSPAGMPVQPRSIQMIGPGVNISLQDPGSFVQTGLLQANSAYSISIDVGGRATLYSSNNSIGSFRTTLAVQTCYANCDYSTTVPILNALDFMCFLNQFTAGSTIANCDGSSTPPILNILDFVCFLDRFSLGCT